MESTLPTIFIGLMGLAVLIYAVLDGFDLGTGILLPTAQSKREHSDVLIASIGPFWDANETWLVLAVGLLLIAFPSAHSYILQDLYIPITIMLIGLILRGVAFDFRAKAAIDMQAFWNQCFKYGSILTSVTQGYMLGRYIVGFNDGFAAQSFSLLSGLGVAAAYSYIGATWIIYKTEGDIQQSAIRWAKYAGRISFVGVALVSVINPLVNPGVFDRWFSYPLVMFVLFIPFCCFLCFILNDVLLSRFPNYVKNTCWLPFMICIVIFTLCFLGVGFSFYPYVVPGQLTIWDAASAPESLQFILYGAVIVVPTILVYTGYSYWVFRGKAETLRYH